MDMKRLQKITEEEKKYLEEYGKGMLERDTEESRRICYKLFKEEYELLKEEGKDVSEFDLYIKSYEGKV